MSLCIFLAIKENIIWRGHFSFLLIMVIAHTPVELAQIKKLLYAVRISDYDQVRRICEKGVDGIINYNDPTDGN